MIVLAWIISFAFPYPAKCTREVLLKMLREFAAEWPGWETFPWRITRDIHQLIDDPPVNFHYLMTQFWLTAYACHVVLTETFASQEDLLDMMIRERFEFVGVFRHHLITALQYLRDQEGKAYIPDCTGIEEGHLGVTQEELARRRRVFREAVERGARETVRVLNYASQATDMNKRVSGRTLRAWAQGDDMPSPQELQVVLSQENGLTVISPTREERAQFARVKKTIPRLLVHGLSAQSLRRPEEPGTAAPLPTVPDPEVAMPPEPKPDVAPPPSVKLAKASIIGDFMGIRFGTEVVELSNRPKPRAFLRFLHKRLANSPERDFYVEEMREAFNAEIPDSHAKRRWTSDRFREDLFKGLEQKFDLLFETLDKSSGHYRLKF
ncbi:MAG: hypothetical protein K8T26_19410 [Lentisphaerae bacterium]|nr:hypothetical protein [Lentisphaerota bacterium]